MIIWVKPHESQPLISTNSYPIPEAIHVVQRFFIKLRTMHENAIKIKQFMQMS